MSGSVVETRKLGLAAFIKMNGGELLGFNADTRQFQFKLAEGQSTNVESLEFEYLNSCCYRHDSELVNLRKLIKR